MSPSSDIRYLVFDIESVADGRLISSVRYPDAGLSPAEAIERFRAELLEESQGKRDFIPHTFQVPAAVVIAKVDSQLQLVDLVSLDEPSFRPHVMTDHFWRGWEAYRHPTWISFNGRSFDMPLMELAAFRYGLSLKTWFASDGPAYTQPRNRYNNRSHLDLHEVLTNFGAIWFRGGLNLAATLLGKPGKMCVQGHMVQELYDRGAHQEISDYCRCDVLDTYFVLLRTRVLQGQLTLEEEAARIEQTRSWLEERTEDCTAYRQYLEAWGDWENPWIAPASAEEAESSSPALPREEVSSPCNAPLSSGEPDAVREN
jgi:3'-5' exonuclease